MRNIAIIENNICTNIVYSDSIEFVERVSGKQCVEYKNPWDAGIGWIFDGEKFTMPSTEIPDENKNAPQN